MYDTCKFVYVCGSMISDHICKTVNNLYTNLGAQKIKPDREPPLNMLPPGGHVRLQGTFKAFPNLVYVNVIK
jgi:hypothetical protein